MRSIFARPVFLFGNIAVLILCVVFFLTPFALRGARMSLSRMQNNVKDWLPSDFPETKELEWFGKHFIGERFVLLTWPGCTEADPSFELLVKKLRSEVLADDENAALEQLGGKGDEASMSKAAERLRARQIGDQYGLIALSDVESYFEDWGGRGEKWLRGHGDTWFFITPRGELFQWDGESNLWDALGRTAERWARGKNRATGDLIATLGDPESNEFHRDPRRLGARFFKSIQTGPEVLAELTAENGALWPRMADIADEEKPAVARRDALKRLTGSLYGPALGPGFDWTAESFQQQLPEDWSLPEDWRSTFDTFVDRLIKREYDGNPSALVAASPQVHSTHWEELFGELGSPSPPRQTCVVVTLSEPGKQDLSRVIGRPLLGKPPGKLLDLATNECQLKLEDIKLGGPPVDNVAIDEEGTITLFNLIGWSAAMGFGLSYFCFRSIRLTIMVFFVGGVSAVSSLSVVWWSGASVDAVLMSMPSLVYVLGLAGAVHIVNYYQEALRSHGPKGAPERALRDAVGPCSLAAVTTALGLLSLYTSNLMPIKKFGLFSAIGVMMTLTLLFTYLPAALQIWPTKQRKADVATSRTTLTQLVENFWVAVGHWIVRHHAVVSIGCLVLMVGVGLGLAKTETSVRLMKLFDPDSKIIRDYGWLESNFGKLVPMELVVRVKPEMLQPSLDELGDTPSDGPDFRLNFLERMEIAARVQQAVERVFGDAGRGVVGNGLSAATFAPDLPPAAASGIFNPERGVYRAKLEANRDQILASDYLRIEPTNDERGNELWRVSLRLAALSDEDYGEFLHEQKLVVEPILVAYRHRDEILRAIDKQRGGTGYGNGRVAIIGSGLTSHEPVATSPGLSAQDSDQQQLYAKTLEDLLTNAGCVAGRMDLDNAKFTQDFATSATFQRNLEKLEAVVLLERNSIVDVDFIRQHAKHFVDARDYRYELGTGKSKTAAELDSPIQVVYTGVVPVVYKAQRTLLNSLAQSMALAFVMIAGVMMILLRDWRARPTVFNLLNVPAGIVSMIPNVFPVVLIFGAMGHANVLVDIGTMMCASVAMGVAVDDTIHFLTWFSKGVREGLDRPAALIRAYRRVATAMTQTTLIGGLGLSVFAFSTFTPTQRFGVMMVALLAAALIGDLIFLPALLAGPLGRFFCPRSAKKEVSPSPVLGGTHFSAKEGGQGQGVRRWEGGKVRKS